MDGSPPGCGGCQTGRVPDGWQFEERVAPARDLHASWPSSEQRPTTRAVARCRPSGTAVVLGSTQRSDVIDHDGSDVVDPVSYTHLTLPTNREV